MRMAIPHGDNTSGSFNLRAYTWQHIVPLLWAMRPAATTKLIKCAAKLLISPNGSSMNTLPNYARGYGHTPHVGLTTIFRSAAQIALQFLVKQMLCASSGPYFTAMKLTATALCLLTTALSANQPNRAELIDGPRPAKTDPKYNHVPSPIGCTINHGFAPPADKNICASWRVSTSQIEIRSVSTFDSAVTSASNIRPLGVQG